jgi:rubrerythrin
MDRMASIELALKNEQTEMEYYLNEAKRSKNPLAKAMFENLARDEKEHMRRIKGLHEKLVSDGKWPEDMPIEVAGTQIAETLNNLVVRSGSAKDHDDDDEQAMRKALDFETRGEQFYKDLAEECENPQEKQFFQFLSEIEREHRLSLTDSLAYLQDPQAWLEEHEKILLDGA